MKFVGWIALVTSVFIGLSLLDVLQNRSPEVAGRKLEAAKLLTANIPPLAAVDVPLDDCTFISKESITAFECKLVAAFNPMNANKPAASWYLVSARRGTDSWRREAIIYSYGSSLWTANLYLSDFNKISGVSLIRYGPWPY